MGAGARTEASRAPSPPDGRGLGRGYTRGVPLELVSDEVLKYWLWVELDAQGNLVLSGQDLSDRAALFGREEYEYGYTVTANDVPRLLESLGATGPASLASIAELLRQHFALVHGVRTSTEFKVWCQRHQIPYTFHSD